MLCVLTFLLHGVTLLNNYIFIDSRTRLTFRVNLLRYLTIDGFLDITILANILPVVIRVSKLVIQGKTRGSMRAQCSQGCTLGVMFLPGISQNASFWLFVLVTRPH